MRAGQKLGHVKSVMGHVVDVGRDQLQGPLVQLGFPFNLDEALPGCRCAWDSSVTFHIRALMLPVRSRDSTSK